MRVRISATPPPTGVELMFCSDLWHTYPASIRISSMTSGPTTFS